MKIRNKIIMFGLLFNLIGCSSPTQVERKNPEPQQIIQENTVARNFKALQDKLNVNSESSDITPTPVNNISLAQTSNTEPLVFDNKPARILFDTGKNPLGNTSGNEIKQLDLLTKVLVKYKFSPVFSPLSQQKSLDNFDVIAIISPSMEYSSSELEILANFVKSGKKVVVTGEWGGYSGFNSDSVNEFLKQVNLRINQDLVKENETSNFKTNAQQIIVSSFQPNPLTNNIKKLVLFSASSVEIIDPVNNSSQAQIIALSSINSFKIKNAEKQSGLIAVSNLEKGKVIVLGDTSLFTNQQVNSNGKVNLEEENNEQLALNLFSI